MGTGTGTGTMLDVTQSWMAREQQVVVPMAAQHASGRVVWSRSVIVSCVAGQQIAVSVSRVWSVAGRIVKYLGGGTHLGARASG